MELSAWLWDSVHKILPFPVPAAELVKELKCWILCCLLLPVLGSRVWTHGKGTLCSLREPWQGWQLHRAGGSKLSRPLLGSAWQFWVPVAEFLLQKAPEFQSWIPPAAESAQCNTHSALHALHGSLALNISSLKASNSMFSNVTSVKFGLWYHIANGMWEALPFWDILHQFYWILQILSLTDEILIWTSN